MELMTIGAFAERTRLSPKALRLYDHLGLLPPARIDPDSGYRFYSRDQVEQARLVALLRRLDMPLKLIGDIVGKPAAEVAAAMTAYWAEAETVAVQRRMLVRYLQARLTGGPEMTSYDIQTRSVGARTIVSLNRHVHTSEAEAFFVSAFGELRASGPGLTGVEGFPYVVYYGEVSDDSDGPIELCRPVAAAPEGLESRVDPAHEEAYIRVAKKDLAWPALAPAVDALEAWVRQEGRQPSGALRQVLIADHRTASPDTPVADLTIPLRA
jgi:DNA-binding transcriptional MerR regulator